MADLERLSRALKAAHAAGDTAAAKKLAQAIRAAQATPATPAGDTSMGTAFAVADKQAEAAGNLGSAAITRRVNQGPLGQAQELMFDKVGNPIREFFGMDPVDIAAVNQASSDEATAKAAQAQQSANQFAQDSNFENLTLDSVNDLGSFFRYVGQKGAQAAPYMAVSMASGGTATYPFSVGEISGALEDIEGKTQEEKDKIATRGGAIMTALENLGIASLLPAGVSNNIIGGIASGAISEGFTEGVQELVVIGSEAVAGKKFTEEELVSRLKESAAAGAAVGSAFKAGGQTVNATSKIFSSDGSVNNPDNMSAEGAAAAGAFARRLREIANANGYDLKDVNANSTKGARETVDKAHIQLAEELKKVFKDLGELVTPDKLKTFIETKDQILAQAAYREARNKTKSTVGQQELDAMRRLVGDTAEGQQAINLMLQLNQLTEVHNAGYKGGLSRITDVFNPLDQNINSYDTASRVVTGTLSPLATAAGAVSTGGASLAPQAALFGTGRAVDAMTGRRSTVDRFVRRNEGNSPDLPAPTAPSLVETKRLQDQQAQDETQRNQEQQKQLNLQLAQQDAPATPGSPQFTMEDATGLSRDGVARILRVLKGRNDNPALIRAIQEYEQSVATGGRIEDLSPLIRAVRQFQEQNPDYVPMVRPPNSLSNPMLAAPAAPGQAPNVDTTEANPVQAQTFGPQLTTQENYNRGIEANIAMNRELVEGVTTDPELNRVQKGRLITSLDVLANNLGSDPVAAAQEQVQKLEDAGVPQEAIDTYVKPYVDRVARQQSRPTATTPGLQAAQEAGVAPTAETQAPVAPELQEFVDAGKRDGSKTRGVFTNTLEAKAKAIRENIGDEEADAYEQAVKGQLQSPDEPILGSINPDIPAPTTVQTAALSAPTPVVHQQIDAPAGVTKHGLLPHLRSETESFRDGKPLFVLKTTNNNAQRQIEAIDEVLSRHPDPASSSEAWGAMLGDAYASRDIPVQPYGFIEDLNNGGAQELLSTLTPGQIADADHGFRNAAEFRQAYTNGEIAVEDTGRLFLWSFLSKGVSPYNQEGLFIDAFGGIDQWINQAADGNLNLDDYKRWAATTAPRGSGKPGAGAIHNLNAFGKDFLLKMSQDAGKGDGRSRLQVIHDMMSDPNTTGKEVRREFLRMGEGVGIDNKVVSFTLLVAGYDDVLVLDRVQMRQMWNDGRFSGINLYDGYKHNGDTVNGSGMALTTTGARGLLVYEAMEKSLQNRLQQIYSDIGRPEAASVGRYHWETWVASSQQEASHGTIDAILRRAKGDPNPLDGVTAKEGEYGAFAYGARYGIENGVPMFTYGVPERGEYKFTVPEFQSFLNDIKRKAKSNKVIPYGFGVQESGNAPWYTREGVDLDALAEKAKEYGTQVRTTDAELREGQAIPDGRTSDASVRETAVLSRATKRSGSSDDIRADEQGQSGRPEGVGVLALQGAAGDPQVVTSLDGLNDPDTLNDFLARPGWAIITATNEKLPDSIRDTRNAESNAYLERQLNEQGIPYVNISGTYQGIDQGPSFLILADEETAMKLGKFHLQESILTNQGLVYTRRPAANTPATQQNMFGPQAQQQDFYSTVSGLPFSMGLDFSKGPGKQFYKPGYSEAPNRPQLPIREKDGMVELHHWSNKRRKTIDPHFAGSGPLNGVERKRGAKISFFGIAPRQSLRDPGTGYVKETGLGSYEHIVLIDPKDLYPVFQDPDGLLQDVGSNWSKAEDIIRDAGYKGYYTTDDGSGSAPLGNVATLFEPIEVTEVREEPALRSADVEPILRDTIPGANPDGPRPDVIPAEKPQVTPEQYKKAVVELIRPQFQIGLKGGELEDGISNFNDAVEFAKKLGIVVRMAMSQNELNTLLKLDTGQGPAKMGAARGMFQRKGPKKKGKGTEGTIWAMKPGADKGDGSYVTDIEALTTLLHEISHAITLGPLDGKADQEIYSYFINRKQSSMPGSGIVGRSDFTPPGSFTDSAIKPLLDTDWEQMSPTQRKVYAEIYDLQENVEAYSPKNPNERRAVRFIRKVMSSGLTPQTKQAYEDYTKMAAEFAVDPVWVYLINPKLAKKLMPVTSKMIQQEFRKANNKVIQFYAHPLSVVLAALVALEMAMDDEEERKQQQMPPGALNQPIPMGALSQA